jgi:hypothetical protein
MGNNVKQIGTFKNFTHILDVRFHNLNINQIVNRILIIILVIWNLGISLYLLVDKVWYDVNRNVDIKYPITDLELIDINK